MSNEFIPMPPMTVTFLGGPNDGVVYERESAELVQLPDELEHPDGLYFRMGDGKWPMWAVNVPHYDVFDHVYVWGPYIKDAAALAND